MCNKNLVYIPNLSLGNTKSVINMVNKIGGEVILANSPEDLIGANKIILPGVGSFDVGMKEIRDAGWLNILNKKALVEKVPILGICLGMQFFFDYSEEGNENSKVQGLGWIKGYLKKFEPSFTNGIKIPHMGWNKIKILNNCELFSDQDSLNDLRYYFVHSYHAICADNSNLVATTFYGSDVTAVVQSENIYGAQFHPEKSHKFGMNLFSNFIKL